MSEKYLKRGVSAKKEDVHNAIKNINKGLYDKLFCKVFDDYLGKDNDYINLMSSDGSGTKSILAYLYWKETGDASVFRGIAQDAIVMNLDDMACVGAVDTFLYSSLINRNKSNISGEVVKEIIEGGQEFFDTMRAHGVDIVYTGGETADIGDVVRTVSVDGSLTARMKKKDIIFTNHIKPGQLIVGLASYGRATYENHYNSGIGSNGLTSARHDLLSDYYKKFTETFEPSVEDSLVYCGSNRLTDKVYENIELGKLILSPTRTFLPVLKKIFDEVKRANIKSIVHCTGGAASKVLHFTEQVRIVKDNYLPIPFIFSHIQKESDTDWKEMFQVFNMGTRLEFYVENKAIANDIIAISKSFNIDAQIMGYVEKSDNSSVEVTHNNQTYKYTP